MGVKVLTPNMVTPSIGERKFSLQTTLLNRGTNLSINLRLCIRSIKHGMRNLSKNVVGGKNVFQIL